MKLELVKNPSEIDGMTWIALFDISSNNIFKNSFEIMKLKFYNKLISSKMFQLILKSGFLTSTILFVFLCTGYPEADCEK